jgi:hypothetical protein
MPGFVNVLGTFRGTWDQADENLVGLVTCAADIFSNITYREIQWPGMLITGKICEVSLVGCTNSWHNRLSTWDLFLGILPLITRVDLGEHSATLRVGQVHRFEFEVWLNCVGMDFSAVIMCVGLGFSPAEPYAL